MAVKVSPPPPMAIPSIFFWLYKVARAFSPCPPTRTPSLVRSLPCSYCPRAPHFLAYRRAPSTAQLVRRHLLVTPERGMASTFSIIDFGV
jgi:hypothetical protein